MKLNDPGQQDEQNNDDIGSAARFQEISDEEWSDSDEDVEDGDNGYQALPQDLPPESEDLDASQDEDFDLDTQSLAGPLNLDYEDESRRNFTQQEERDRAEVFTSNPRQNSIDLSSEKLSAIQGAMSKIVIPPSAVPDWAGKMTDEEWKVLLEQKLGIKAVTNAEKQ